MARIGFPSDVSAALAVWRAQPLLPLASLGIGLLTAGSDGGFVGFALSLLLLALLAWPGAERAWYFRLWAGAGTSLRQALDANGTYWGRFLRLGLLVVVPLAALSLAVAAALGDAGSLDELVDGWRWVAAAVLLGVLLDVRLTYVVPALVFTTDSARQAWGIGGRLLRSSWPACAPYALVPPLVLSVAADWNGLGLLGDLLVVLTTLFATLMRGVILASYLRLARAADLRVELPEELRSPERQL